MTDHPTGGECQIALERLRGLGLIVLVNQASGALAIVRRGTSFAQVPTSQWRPGLTLRQVCDLAGHPGRLALYLERGWPLGWLDAQRRPRPVAVSRPPADLADPWSDAPADAPPDGRLGRPVGSRNGP